MIIRLGLIEPDGPTWQPAIGIFVALVLAWALLAYRLIRRHARAVEESNQSLRRVQSALRESESRKSAIFEAALDCIISMDAEGRIIEFNPAAERVFRMSRAQVLGRPLADTIIPPAHRERHRQGLNHFLKTGQGPVLDRRVEMTAVRSDGTEFPIELTVTCIRGHGSPIFTGFIRDITDRRRALDALLSSENRLRLMTEQMPAIVATTDEHLRVTSIAGAGLSAVRRTPEQVIGRTIYEILQSNDSHLPPIQAHLKALSGESARYEIGFGGRILQGHCEPLRDAHGGITGTIGVALDVTDLKRAQEERHRFFSLMSDLFCVISIEGVIRLINPAWEKILGHSQDLIRSRPLFDLVHPEDRRVALREFQKLRGGAAGVAFEVRLLSADGTYRWFSWSASAFIEQDSIYAVARDIGERKTAERRLDLQYRVAHALAESKSVNEVAPKIFQSVCEEIGFEVGAWWSIDRTEGVLFCSYFWSMPGLDVSAYRSRTLELRYPPGLGLPGHVWASGESSWVSDVLRDAKFIRGADAARSGLHAALAIPIVQGEEVLGVVEFASRRVRSPDDDLLHLSSAIGRQIGQFIKRKSAEESLKDLEERFRLLVDGVTDYAITMLDPEGRVVSWNAGAERITGYTADEARGMHFSMFHRVEDRQMDRPARELREAAEEGRCREEGWRLRKDGTRFWANVVITALRDESGRLRGFSKIMHDMTDRKRAERELSESEARYRLLAENASDIISLYTPDGIARYVSPACLQVLGYPPDELIGKSLEGFVPADDRASVAQFHQKLLASREPLTLSFRHRKKTGGLVWIETTARTVRDHATDAPLEIIAISRDITQRMQVEEIKNEIISIVSHELRTPLASIQGSLGLLAGGVAGELPGKARNLVEIAASNCGRLTRMINDYLDLKSIESGKMEFDLKPVELRSILQQAIESNRSLGDAQRIGFILDPGEPNVFVTADADRLMQVLTNLLSNAAKFSPPGEPVRVSMTRREGTVRIEVSDRGPGIPPEFRDRIFQKFAQADRTKKGSGLGLSISKAIVEKFGGVIGFNSPSGGGTTFYLELPQGEAPIRPRNSPTEKVPTK